MDEDDEPRNYRARRRYIYCSFVCCMIFYLFCVTGSVVHGQQVTAESVSRIGDELSRHLNKAFKDATKWHDIIRVYESLTVPEVFDPHSELKHIKSQIEKYLIDRSKMAWDAKVSLESQDLGNSSESSVNDPFSQHFVRYIDAKKATDETVVYADGHFGGIIFVNATRELSLRPNVNFYRIPTSSEASAVHVPTPVYNRNPELLEHIQWSDIDQLYRRNREKIKDLSFQKFCSVSGFLRYFPAAPWIYDDPVTELDMFDCRNTEWFIDAATMSKNVIIMLDMSGSMLGQRFEIAKQTIEAILDTLSDNDFFNIMAFSKAPTLLDNCTDEGLLQATMRNKKLLRSQLLNVSSEGKADYEAALTVAFKTLLNIKNGSRLSQTPMGCNDVIMLITDGAPGYFKKTFNLYNQERRVRFFSFLIGEESTDFEEVKWMACHNRGYMVHVSNMADVQEKVQHYVKVMSRPISRQSHSIQRNNAVWGSVSKERMSNQYVISVGYPVVLDNEFMGVSAVSVPMIELIQIAHPSMIGPMSYFFMLDNNGYAMFHPQLRAIDEVTKETKPTFNNMDFFQIEIQRPLSEVPELATVACDQNDNKKMEVYYGVNGVQRIYVQKNTYKSVCIEGTHFTIGVSIAENDKMRLRRRESWQHSSIQLSWFQDNNWRIHPEWRYCLLNDSDTALSAEAAITTYANQMHLTGKLPELCKPRAVLVEKLLLDIQATNSFSALWDQEWKENKKNGIHLAFFATTSGLIRFYNESLEEAYYDAAEFSTSNYSEKAYRHFVLELNRRSSDDSYYKRAVRMRGKTVYDVNLHSHLWQAPNVPNAYNKDENFTILGIAYQALYIDDALIGVVGIEFMYDKLAKWMSSHGCNPRSEHARCFLLDEHAMVFYSSQPDISYEETLFDFERSVNNPRFNRRSVIGFFFGHISRVTEWTMETLIKKGFFKKITFVDNQGMCENPVPVVAGASAITVPLSHLRQVIFWFISRVFVLIRELSFIFLSSILSSSSLPRASAYTTTFKSPTAGRFPCQQQSEYYIADTERASMMSTSLLEGEDAERPCKQNAAQCAIRVYAQWIEKTNLLLVVIKQDEQSACYDETQCPKQSPSPVPFGFVKKEAIVPPTPSPTAEVIKSFAPGRDAETKPKADRTHCQSASPIQRKNIMQCIKEDFVDESHLPCSMSPRFHSMPVLTFFAIVFRYLMYQF